MKTMRCLLTPTPTGRLISQFHCLHAFSLYLGMLPSYFKHNNLFPNR
jgi:hypothetical protein